MLHEPDARVSSTRCSASSASTGPAGSPIRRSRSISVALVDIWKGVGLATLIYIAGIVAIPQEYFEAARVDGAGGVKTFWHVTLPLLWPATSTVIILSLIGGLRSFDLIWTMTRGGPGFTSDVLASVVFKQYQAGFYGLSTAGNVVLFVLVTAIILPGQLVPEPEGGRAVRTRTRYVARGSSRSSCRSSSSSSRSRSSCVTAAKGRPESDQLDFTWPTEWHLWEQHRRGLAGARLHARSPR